MNNADVGTDFALPPVEDDFAALAALPETGAPVYATITDPANGLQTCLSEELGDAVSYSLGTNTLEVGEGSTTTSDFNHQNLHAAQDINGSINQVYDHALTQEDTAVALLLAEANAEAYAYTTHQEAVRFHPEVTSTYETTITDLDLSAVFNAAFDASMATDATTEQALQAGGQAIAESLLNGESRSWMIGYAEAVADTAAASGTVSSTDPDYTAARTTILSNLGRVSGTVNMTPASLTNADTAPAAIARIIQASGLEFG